MDTTRRAIGGGKLLTAGAFLAVAMVFGSAMAANSEASNLEFASMQEVEDLYGAACPGWDSNGDGCESGCMRQCSILLSSWTWDSVQCSRMTTPCDDEDGSSGNGSCGSYQYVAQCAD